MSTHVYIHAMLNGPGALILAEIHGRMLSSKLYGHATSINLTLVGPPEARSYVKQWLAPWDKYAIRYESDDVTDYEWPALLCIQNDAAVMAPTDSIIYAHTKGASNSMRDDVPTNIQRNLAYWKDALLTATIDNWRQVVSTLSSCHTTGPFLWHQSVQAKDSSPGVMEPTHSIYCGNMWGATAEWINSRPRITDEDCAIREYAERYLLEGMDPRNKRIHNSRPLPTDQELGTPFYDLYDFQEKYQNGPLYPRQDVFLPSVAN